MIGSRFFSIRASVLLSAVFLAASIRCEAAPISFPKGYIPFTQLDYKTIPDAQGYSVVVGEVKTDQAFGDLFHYLQSLPVVAGNQQYVGQSIELAPGIFFNNVMVPTNAERFGDFSDLGVNVYDPWTYRPSSSPTQFAMSYTSPLGAYSTFPSNIIPESRLFEVYAFRVGPGGAASSAPEPSDLTLVGFGVIALLTLTFLRGSQRRSADAI